MTILLRPVHFVASDGQRRGKCRIAEVVDHGIETVDLCIDGDPKDFLSFVDAEELFAHTTPRNVRFDPNGRPGTFHFDEQCPIVKKEREAANEIITRYIEHKRRLDKRIAHADRRRA